MSPLKKVWAFFVDGIETILIAIAICLVVYLFLFRPFQVNGSSMYPNFQDKEYVLTNIISLRFENPIKGDVVVFKAPSDGEKDYIKRVVGIPGDNISIRNGAVYINNSKFDESKYLQDGLFTTGGSYLRDGQSITLNSDEYFVMGDNRLSSSDSREWGPVNKTAIIGKSFFVYWPPKEMKVIKNPFQ